MVFFFVSCGQVPFGSFDVVLCLDLDEGIPVEIFLSETFSLETGLWTTGIVMVGAVLTYAYTYIDRVANKNMTYAQQLRDYEDGVLQTR